jgi:hypothetical protein
VSYEKCRNKAEKCKIIKCGSNSDMVCGTDGKPYKSESSHDNILYIYKPNSSLQTFACFNSPLAGMCNFYSEFILGYCKLKGLAINHLYNCQEFYAF